MRPILWILNMIPWSFHPLLVRALSKNGVWGVLFFRRLPFEIALLRDVVVDLMLILFIRYVQGWDNESGSSVFTNGQTVIEGLLWLAVMDLFWHPRDSSPLLGMGKLLINWRLGGRLVSLLCWSTSCIGSVVLLLKLYWEFGWGSSLTWGTCQFVGSTEGLVILDINGGSFLEHLLLLIEVFKFLKRQGQSERNYEIPSTCNLSDLFSCQLLNFMWSRLLQSVFLPKLASLIRPPGVDLTISGEDGHETGSSHFEINHIKCTHRFNSVGCVKLSERPCPPEVELAILCLCAREGPSSYLDQFGEW